ncbi:MAG: hypothetical protein NVV59_08330 [Chitinophagaceae bacterium]|nr:hypothetical protein [Chitinophagaceae bacterium]
MTILNFENSFRKKKVDKAREMFQRGQVIELHKASVRWVAKMKIGAYKTQLELSGIEIGDSTCTCDSRSNTGYCEHAVAMMFALRKELNFYPALTTARAKLAAANTDLAKQIKELDAPDVAIYDSDEDLFVTTARKILAQAAKSIKKGDIRSGLGECLETVRKINEMCTVLCDDFKASDKLFSEAFALLKETIHCITDEEIIEEIAHDLRVEVLRNYRENEYLFTQWMKLLRPISNQGNREQKFRNVIATLDQIRAAYGDFRYSY